MDKQNISKEVDKNSGVLFLDADTIRKEDLDLSPLKKIAEPLILLANCVGEERYSHYPDAWCVITNKVVLDRRFFESRPAVRLVCVIATGTNNVDLDAAKDHEVAVVNCRDYSTETVAQQVLMLMLMCARNFQRYQTELAKGAWSLSPIFCLLDHPIVELSGLRLGIIGYGEIGRRVEQLANLFGMKVAIAERSGCKPREGRESFETVLQTSDILSLHCPLSESTQHLINRETLSLMRKNAFLINTARGGLIEEADLLQALSEGWIAGAAVDVLSSEPPSGNHPFIKANIPNLVITPHHAWASIQARQKAIEQTAENITAWLQGNELRRVV